MRRALPFVVYLALLSLLSGWLLSRMSWIGRVGVNLFHREYRFLKYWYKGAALVFVVLLALFLLQSWARRRLSPAKSRGVQIFALVAAVAGLWATYSDFRSDWSHSLLRERFHLGAYLFWIGWMSVSLYLLTPRRSSQEATE